MIYPKLSFALVKTIKKEGYLVKFDRKSRLHETNMRHLVSLFQIDIYFYKCIVVLFISNLWSFISRLWFCEN